jgi:very-short-patch-repair endonuclease
MERAGRKTQAVLVKFGPQPLERAIGELAARQHGVVATRQLCALGVTSQAVSLRARNGRMHRVHRGVYAVGHPPLTARGHWMAAVLACGPGSVLRHNSAAALWGLRQSSARLIDVTTRRTGRARSGIRIHRPRTLRPDETTTENRIPVTAPARTILDLAALKSTRPEHILDRNETLRLTDYPSLAALARAHPRHRGATRMLATLDRHTAGASFTRSGLERLFLDLCAQHGLPRPRANTVVAGKEVDFLFEPQRLIVETDSWAYHRTRTAFEDDRARDAVMARAGYRTLRFTDDHLTTDAAGVVAILTAILEDKLTPHPTANATIPTKIAAAASIRRLG